MNYQALGIQDEPDLKTRIERGRPQRTRTLSSGWGGGEEAHSPRVYFF